MVLARFLGQRISDWSGWSPHFTGVLNLFRDFGLSAAQCSGRHVTEEQTSTLFWINLLVGVILAELW